MKRSRVFARIWRLHPGPTATPRKWILLSFLLMAGLMPFEKGQAQILNIKAGYPENYSLELGLLLPTDSWGGGSWSIGFPGVRGPTLSFEAGTRGHKAHVGYGEFGSALHAMRLTGFYMWEDDDRHIGIQGFASLVGICGAVGVMRRTDTDSYTVTISVGFGW